MKKYIAPACEMMNLATEGHILNPSPTPSIVIDPDPEHGVDGQLSNRYDYDADWEDE